MKNTKTFSLKKGQLPVIQELIQHYGLEDHFTGELLIKGCDPIIQSPHRLADAVSYVLALQAICAASLWNYRTGKSTDITLDCLDAIHFLHTPHFIWQSGYQILLDAEHVPTNGIFSCRDHRKVMIMAGPPYPKLMNGYLNFFDCGNNRESLAKAILKWPAEELQEKLSSMGFPCAIAYTKEEWRSSPQGRSLMDVPVIEIEKIGDSAPQKFDARSPFPLSNIRVVDFTHVLAGPKSTRSLAEFGADVMHISSPNHPDTLAQNLGVNVGKRSAFLNLREEEDHKTLRQLVMQADLFAQSYRPAVLDRFSINAKDLVKGHPRGLVYLSINAYGFYGPWKNRPGFDHNAQIATGFSVDEGSFENPCYSPVFYLNDLMTGYFAAAGMMIALLRRAKEGGSYHVKVSLARSAMWVQDLGFIDKKQYAQCPKTDTYPVRLETIHNAYGEVTQLAPAVSFSAMHYNTCPLLSPFGTDKPQW